MTEEHRSSVNFKHFLQDQVQLYPFSPDEAALVELIANSLDAKCTCIEINISERESTFALIDNGRGMTEQGFKDYHDFAMSLKKRGEGIGFAGLGAKLGLWISKKVETETTSDSFHDCSEWYFKDDDLFWRRVIEKGFLVITKKPKKTLSNNGTRTAFYLKDKGSELLNANTIELIIKKHYYPLFDPFISAIYPKLGIYRGPIEFNINSKHVISPDLYPKDKVEQREEFKLVSKRKKVGKRKKDVEGVGYFVLTKDELPEEQWGIAISCYGKVIKREWFGTFSKDMKRVTGFVEVPYLSSILTTTKCDFLRTGATALKYRPFYREMQKRFSSWLEKVGKLEKKSETEKEDTKLEKLLKQILSQVPELQTIFAMPMKKDVGQPNPAGNTQAEPLPEPSEVNRTWPGGGGGGDIIVPPGPEEKKPLEPRPGGKELSKPISRLVLFGPVVRLVKDPADPRLSWVFSDEIRINSGHPCFVKASNSGFEYYHNLLAIALALVREKGPNNYDEGEALMTKFFKAWGTLK